MPADRLLETLLWSLQTWTDQQDTPRLLATAASLLTTLTNPLNIQLLVAHILCAPAIWEHPDGLSTCQPVIGLFHAACVAILQHERDVRRGMAKSLLMGQLSVGGGMSIQEWATAVVRGADGRSVRWKHLLVLGGLLLGSNTAAECRFSVGLETRLEAALVQAANWALAEARDGDDLGAQTVAMVLNRVFPILRQSERDRLDYDSLLPVLMGAVFFSREGFQSAYFLGPVDPDVVGEAGEKLNWSAQSSSFRQLKRITTRPLMTWMGPLSRLISHAAENVQDPRLILTIIDDLAGFSRTLALQWRQLKISAIELSEESQHLQEEAIKTTVPLLWKILKNALFATVIVLRGAFGRMVGESALTADSVAPAVATNVLHILRNMYFISSRLGSHTFAQHTFVYLTAIDTLAQYPPQADAFLRSILPAAIGTIPDHLLDRCHDLYFLNTAEHFSVVLSPEANEDLLVSAATPYLNADTAGQLGPLFEAAHSVMLSVLSAPSSAAQIAPKHLPFYASTLFAAFPTKLSARQFRVAFKTLLRITTPPSPMSSSQPDLAGTLCELLRHRALSASPATTPPRAEPVDADEPPLSERAVVVLTLLDALPILPAPMLEEWLPLCADLAGRVHTDDPDLGAVVKRRFWEVLVGGEMDPEMSLLAVAWWSTRGGREKVLFGDDGRSDDADVPSSETEKNRYVMSGALPAANDVADGRPRESKL